MDLYLPDTNIFIYAFHGEEPAATRVKTWITSKQLIVSSIVAAEFLSGGQDVERDKFLALLDRLGTTPVDTAVARTASDYKRQFLKQKPGLRLPDALIAATCKLYSATLVTNNPGDFPMDDITKLSL
jgi:predicted nucleic acid-binding protein